MRKNIFNLFILTQLFFVLSNFSVLFCMGPDLPAEMQEEPVEVSQEMLQADQVADKQVGDLSFEIEDIDKQESELLNQLKQMDSELDKAINESVSARKLKSEMINVASEGAAKEDLKKLKASLRKIKEIRDQVRIEFARTFDIAIAKIDVSMKRVKEKVGTLEKKGLATKKIELPEEEVLEIQEVVEEEDAKSIEAQESSFFNGAVKVVAFVIGGVRNVGNWFARVFSQAAVKSRDKVMDVNVMQSAQTMQKTGITEPVKPSVLETEILEQDMEIAVPLVATQALPVDPVLQKVKDDMTELQSSIDELELEKQKISKKRESLEKIKTKRLEQIRKKVELMSELELEMVSKEIEDAKPAWRKAAEYVFAKILDTISFVFKKIKLYSILFYQNFLKTKIRRFVTAVQNRVEEIEKPEEEIILVEEEIAEVPVSSSMGMGGVASPQAGMGMQSGMPAPEEMPPQPSAKEMMGPPPTTSGMGM